MEYNFYEIGEKIRNLRKSQGQSQDEFIDMLKNKHKISITRNRLSAIENGKRKNFSLEFLLAICQEYGCDMGYLFGEHKEKTYNNYFICSSTGLTEETIHKLEFEKDNCRIEHFNAFILEPDFWEVLECFEMYKNVSEELIEKGKKQSKAFWEQYALATDESTKNTFRMAAIVLDGEKRKYNAEKQNCINMLEKIVDKFLPNDKY